MNLSDFHTSKKSFPCICTCFSVFLYLHHPAENRNTADSKLSHTQYVSFPQGNLIKYYVHSEKSQVLWIGGSCSAYQSHRWPCLAVFTSERCKPAKNWDIDPEQTFSIPLFFSLCPPCCIFTPIISIITRTKAPSPSVCNIHSCGAGVWEKLGHNLFLVSSDSEHHQHHRRERRPQRQNDSVSACGLDHRLPRRHQRNRLLWEGSGEDG